MNDQNFEFKRDDLLTASGTSGEIRPEPRPFPRSEIGELLWDFCKRDMSYTDALDALEAFWKEANK